MGFASKKFVIILLALIFSFILAITGKMTPEWAGIIAVITPAYHYIQGKIDEKPNA